MEMASDMDEEDKNTRTRRLGFRPQKENIYNTLLPYGELLDTEAVQLFNEIKTNLVKSVLAREMRPGCALWTSRLNKYIKIYGMMFSKEDHIALIKLFYELITIPDLEPTRINKCATTLTQLLKKRNLLSRDELVLPWRPLYDLLVRVILKSKNQIGMYRYFSTFEANVFSAIRHARIYFPAEATQEILDEFRPQLCPFNTSDIADTFKILDAFLPVLVKPSEADVSYKLWFEEFMDLWEQCNNTSGWENYIMWLVTRLSNYNMGSIDWEPYMSKMFVRFIRSFQLPVVFKQKQLGRQHKFDISGMALWIICALNGDKNSAFSHLEKLMQTLVTYFYPANVGRWTPKLREFLRQLSFHFVERIYTERHKTPTWENPIPDHYKLTDQDIDRFVNILKPCLEQAMFSRMGMQETSLALQYMASIRPNIICPLVLDKLYASMDSLTEPHKLTSSMMAVTAVGRYLVQGERVNYPEGPTHVIPLLMSLLPGIDPNDLKKSYVTFNLIVHFVNMVPLINSAEAFKYHELSEEEHIVCEASAGLEDFVLQFFDKLCVWVESSSLDFVRLEQITNNNNLKNKEDALVEMAVGTLVIVVLSQCSPEIYSSALKKMYNFIVGKIMEVHISGKILAIICRAFVKVNPKEALKLFIPYVCDTLERILVENPSIVNEEHIDDQFLFNLLVLSEIVDGHSEIMTYIDHITRILDFTLHMNCLSATQLSARLLEVTLTTLTNIGPTEFRSSTKSYSSSVKDFLSIREWGKAYTKKELKIQWYSPGDKEIDCIQKLVDKYLSLELDKLRSYTEGKVVMSRQELKVSLKIVLSSMSCHSVLPLWDEAPIQLTESVIEPRPFNLIVNNSKAVYLNGKNVRKEVTEVLHNLQRKILETDEGDTQSIEVLIQVYNIILFNKTRGQDFEFHWKNFHINKKMLEDRLHQKKLHVRHILIDRAILQQQFRNESRNSTFTASHKQILLDLFELGVSRYSDVRKAAQSRLFAAVQYFPYSYCVLTPKIKEVLQMDSQENHEAFKGCLHILLEPKKSPIVARHDWQFVKELWPLVVRSMPSEKLSIVNLINGVNEAVHKHFPTIAINLVIPQSTIEAAFKLGSKCLLDNFRKEIENGENYLKAKSEKRRQAYCDTLDALLEACESGTLHWRYHLMAMSFFKVLVHFDVNYNARIVKFFLRASINESIMVRKCAMKVLVFILIQNKPKFTKEVVDLILQGDTKPLPGIRKDNEWLLYDSQNVAKTAEEWNNSRFLHNVNYGYYCWPKKLELYDKYDKLNNFSKRKERLSEVEKELLSFFKDNDNLDLLFRYLSLEDKKGQDQFNAYRFLMFKNLFKIFEDEFLDLFLDRVEKLVQEEQESSQRCACEIIAGIVRGSKHWSFDQTQRLWTRLIPIFEMAFNNICLEATTDWTFCVTMCLETRDPNSIYWLLEFLSESPFQGQTSVSTSTRLCLLYVGLTQQAWKNRELTWRLLENLKSYLDHPFQNIREKVSNCLMFVFSKDLQHPKGSASLESPSLKDFFKSVKPKLDQLNESVLSKVNGDEEGVDKACNQLNLVSLDGQDERQNLARLYKVVAKFFTAGAARSNSTTIPEFFELLPLAALLQSNEYDEELVSISVNLLVTLAQSMTLPEYIPYALNAIETVAKSPSWSARAAIAEFVPVFVFYNIFTIYSSKEFSNKVQEIVLDLLVDVKPEVRISAGQVLSGLLHCQFIEEPLKLLKLFAKKAKTKLVKPQDLRIRHGGVLGLCAFISSHPYDVPEYLPDVFGYLGAHLNDPQPIPSTIRKVLGDFKRTHHDNWEIHKLKFTEDELAVLSDLTVPPSYYV